MRPGWGRSIHPGRALPRFFRGTYTVDYESGIVTANVITDVLRQYTGTAQPRPFKIVRDELLIGDGKTYLRRFKRVA